MQMTFIINSQNPETLKILLQLQGGDNWSYWEQEREKKRKQPLLPYILDFCAIKSVRTQIIHTPSLAQL